ncbi:diguanylate cyclase domain-containing protein [Geovibrio ferrireducens]|uniref:diguanylate cyclase domain-containing protein n=1 Tax=Geovibrio ferrireducens TaxID=46201 RepID=UPI002247EE3C|nr:diguanylate cyclase [Geovibrio ferrireducens]
MTLAVIDDARTDLKPLKDALSRIEEISWVENMTLLESFDKLAILSPAKPLIQPDIILINFENNTEAYEVTLAVKSDGKYTDTVVISFGNANSEDIVRSMLETGCMDYIKDFSDRTEIFARMRTAVALRKEIISRISREKEIEENNRKLEDISNIDGLTGVLSRRYFIYKVEEEVSRAIRTQAAIALLRIDITDFRDYNAKYGFLEGDKVLRRISSALKKSAKRPGDLLARVGGNSFALFLPSTDLKGAEFIAKTVIKHINNLVIEHETPEGKFLTIHVGGMSVTPRITDDAAGLLNMIADITMECSVGIDAGQNFFCIKN